MSNITEQEDRPDWLREHGRWMILNRRAMLALVKHDLTLTDDTPFIDLTPIRMRFEPRQKLTAIEEWRRMEQREEIVMIAIAIACLILGNILVWFYIPNV